ncbi:hypothetical protein LV84_04286 [Algoriphagus ratkowskyi]|uniref:Uncharacterized protein n=1 Tax=Algoriphagus ratkowskyi TaxID=57028 RepID=A0A2W7SEW5_9BACT|nr:hypothetical protein [Algoriphagus ratkowskyi]PZX49222.1 hypothetical protein LV84_04286 [Algoriphagus ratkowskyi]TXD75364.1 hypothetical protein ESW18_20825 [Algoriphagus ratkowskyi]
MSPKSFFLFCFLGLALVFWMPAFAQTIPAVPKSLSVGEGLSKGFPSGGLESITTKPEIPYLEELKQIQSLKKSYDSLRKELKELKEITADSTQRDSLFTLAKERSKALLEQESKKLESLIQSEDIPGEEIKNASKNTLDRVKDSKARLEKINQIGELESLVDQNNENLKALTNEWIMPKLEEQISGIVQDGFDPRSAELPDFYGKDAPIL